MPKPIKRLSSYIRTAEGVRLTVFLYEILVLIALLCLAFAYFKTSTLHGGIPKELRGLPLYSAWFGALGAVAISLKGVYDHPPRDKEGESQWHSGWPLWYFGRPFSGILVGIMTFVLLRAIYPSGTPTPGVIEAAAFILGTQEKRFFEFLAEVGKLVVAVPQKSDGDRVHK